MHIWSRYLVSPSIIRAWNVPLPSLFLYKSYLPTRPASSIESPFQNAWDPVACHPNWCFIKYPHALFSDCFLFSFTDSLFFGVTHWVWFVFPLSQSTWMCWAQRNADNFIWWNIVKVIEKVEIWKFRPGFVTVDKSLHISGFQSLSVKWKRAELENL